MPEIFAFRRWRLVSLSLAFLALAGCSAGQPSSGFIEPRLTNAYIPLSERDAVVLNHWAAAFAIAPNVGVTNDHNARFIPHDMVIAHSQNYDLLFFRTGSHSLPALGKAVMGEDVIAYGQGASDELREARGTVMGLEEVVKARCAVCRAQKAMIFDARAGGGFSGGPVVDAKTGAIVGITFGYVDGKAHDGGRRMYAYDMDLVIGEMRKLLVGMPEIMERPEPEPEAALRPYMPDAQTAPDPKAAMPEQSPQ